MLKKIGVLGYKVFDSLIDRDSGNILNNPTEDEPILFCRRRSANARGKRTNEGFVILSGSKIAHGFNNSAPDWVYDLRKKHAQDIQKDLSISKDLLFSSPSAAAAFVIGGTANGLVEWKSAADITLRNLEAQK